MPALMTSDMLDWLKAVCDNPAKSSDSGRVLRWKAAQRDVYLKAEALHNKQSANPKSPRAKAENLGFSIRSED